MIRALFYLVIVTVCQAHCHRAQCHTAV